MWFKTAVTCMLFQAQKVHIQRISFVALPYELYAHANNSSVDIISFNLL